MPTNPTRDEAVVRLNVQAFLSLGQPDWKQHADPVGPFVYYTDHSEIVNALRGEVQRLREALEVIAWKRSPGPMPSRIPGSVMQQIEVIALNALKDPTP